MHIYTNAWGLPPGRVAPLSRADLVRLTSISDDDKRKDLDNDFGEEDNNSDSDIDDEGGSFLIIYSITFKRKLTT